jgi:hypothetical protein
VAGASTVLRLEAGRVTLNQLHSSRRFPNFGGERKEKIGSKILKQVEKKIFSNSVTDFLKEGRKFGEREVSGLG